MLNKQVDILCDQFPEHLVKIRKSKGMTQRELALASGLSRKVIGLYEGGHHEPTLGSIYKLAHGLDVHPSTLIPSPTTIITIDESDMVDLDFALERLNDMMDEARETISKLRGEETEDDDV